MLLIIVSDPRNGIVRSITPTSAGNTMDTDVRRARRMQFRDSKIVVWDTDTQKAIHNEMVYSAETLIEMERFLCDDSELNALMRNKESVKALKAFRRAFAFMLLQDAKWMMEGHFGSFTITQKR